MDIVSYTKKSFLLVIDTDSYNFQYKDDTEIRAIGGKRRLDLERPYEIVYIFRHNRLMDVNELVNKKLNGKLPERFTVKRTSSKGWTKVLLTLVLGAGLAAVSLFGHSKISDGSMIYTNVPFSTEVYTWPDWCIATNRWY